MKPDFVVDIGNSRIKWGRCLPTVADGGWVSLPLDDMNAWEEQADRWEAGVDSVWAVAGVNPPRTEQFLKWQKTRGGSALHFTTYTDLPIAVNVDEPGEVGLDRLLGAVAAKSLAPVGTAVITVDVGTAATVNSVDEQGMFQGGAILPGPTLTGRALHHHTAKLLLVEPVAVPRLTGPGKNTSAAITLGIAAAITGGICLLVSELAALSATPPCLFLTGGGLGAIAHAHFGGVADVMVCPYLTLEGLRIAAATSLDKRRGRHA